MQRIEFHAQMVLHAILVREHLEEHGAAARYLRLPVPPAQHLGRFPQQRIERAFRRLDQVRHYGIRHFDPRRELIGQHLRIGHLRRSQQHPVGPLRPIQRRADVGRRQVRRVLRCVEHRHRHEPWRLIHVLVEPGRRVERLRHFVVGQISCPQRFRCVSRHHAGPILHVAHRALRYQTVVDFQDVPVRVGVVGVPHGDRHHFQSVLKFRQIPRFAHAEPLLQHLRAIEAGHAHCHNHAVFVVNHRPVHAAQHLDFLFLERSIRLLDFHRLRGVLERTHFAVEFILIALHRQAVKIHRVDGVHRSAPAGVSIEADHRRRESDLRRAVKIVSGPHQVHFHVAEKCVAPGQMRIDHQHGLPAGRARRPDGPRVRPRRNFRNLRQHRARQLLALQCCVHFAPHPLHRSHVHVMHRAQRMPDDVDARNRQHHAVLLPDGLRMRLGVIVNAAREFVHILAENGILRLIPGFGPLGNFVQSHPAVQRGVLRSPVFRRPASRLAVKQQQEIPLSLRLGPAVSVEHGLPVRRENMRYAILIPEDLGRSRCGATGGEKGAKERSHDRNHCNRAA